MLGYRFTENIGESSSESTFDSLFKLFKELLLYTSGNIAEALEWLTELDKEYNLTDDNYGIADFINELNERGYMLRQTDGNG
ncbi:MAG TPA: hypothetical protein PKD40_07640, partial [Saprospiraceae bacterium]|nr:hypothetical protein [Saprospiraceae bacterium]